MDWVRCPRWACFLIGCGVLMVGPSAGFAQAPAVMPVAATLLPPSFDPEPPPAPQPEPEPPRAVKILPPTEPAEPADRTLPINLPTALHLAGVQPLEIALAEQRVAAGAALLERAEALWLPTLFLGVDYQRHDGRIQDVVGTLFDTSKSSLMVGVGPSAVFALSDAIYAPLAARQVVEARQFGVQAARNDSLLAVAEAYFSVQQARGELAGAAEAVRRAGDLANRAEKLAAGLAPPVEINRARTELARRQQAAQLAYERWQVAGAELARLLRLTPGALVQPVEPPHLRVNLLNAELSVDELIPVGLTHRPELAAQQALVRFTLARLKQERIRPLIPSLVLRGNATPGGPLSSGVFGGGINDDMSNFAARNTMGVQVLWEVQNLGFGNRAAVKERAAENQLAALELLRTQDRVAAEVVAAHAQAKQAALRVRAAEEGLKNAVETADKNLEGLSQTRRVGEVLVLVFRPQEVVAAIQALGQAYNDYYGAVADANRAQFRLYRALGQPAQCLFQNAPQLQGPAVPVPLANGVR